MPSLPITPKYDPGPEIGVSTPTRMTFFSCACAAKVAQASARIAPSSASFIDSLLGRCGQCTKAARFPQGLTDAERKRDFSLQPGRRSMQSRVFGGHGT